MNKLSFLIPREIVAFFTSVLRIFFGKPFQPIFKICLNKIKKINPSININDVIVIGDSLATDILGANNAKIKSVLVARGIHKNSILSPLSEKSRSNTLKLLFNKYKAYPNYIITRFSH